MNKVISIIIPTYNMEKYLDKCLSSLVIKDMDSVEIIVVNDGSKDRSLEIANSYANKYPDSFIVIDKENGNYGSCVNVGLYKASGKYVKVLDADDSFDTANFEEMVSVLKCNDVDLFLSDTINVFASSEKQRSLPLPKNDIVDFTDIVIQNRKRFGEISMHNVTYKRENLIGINYRQTEGLFYTDNEWIYKPMSTVKNVYYMPKPIYRYLLAREGQSVSVEVMKKHFYDDVMVTVKMLRDYSDMVLLNPRLKSVYYWYAFKRVVWLYRRMIVAWQCFDNEDLLNFDKLLKTDYPKFYKETCKRLLSTPLFPYPFISLWRRNPNGAFLKSMVKLYHYKKKLA